MIMNRLHCEGRMLLTVSACGAGAITGFIPLPTVEATPLGHEDNRIVKGLILFVYINNTKIILAFL